MKSFATFNEVVKSFRYYDCNDPEKLFSDAHIVSPFRGVPSTSKNIAIVSAGPATRSSQTKTPQITSMPHEELCDICLSQCPYEVSKIRHFFNPRIVTDSSSMYSFKRMTGLECGHRFCATCWAQYLTTKIMDEGMGQVNNKI